MLRKILLLILFVGIAPLVIGMFVFYFEQTVLIRETTGRDFQQAAEQIAQRIDTVVNAQVALLKKIATSPQLRYLLNEEKKELLAAFLINEAKKYHLFELRELRIINEHSEGEEDKQLWMYVVGPGKGEYLSDIWYDKDKRQFFIDAAVRITDEMSNKRAVLKTILPANAIGMIIHEWQRGSTGYTRMVTINGQVIVSPRQVNMLPYKLNAALTGQITQFRNGWTEAKEEGERILHGFSPVKASYRVKGGVFGEYKWFVLVSQNSNEALIKIYRFIVKSILLGIALITIIVLVGGYVTYKFIQPIKLLGRGVRIIGQGNLSYRLNINTGDEIEELSREFNQMAVKLKDIYDHLEDKILERTKKIKEANTRLQKNQIELQAAQGQLLAVAEELEYANARMEEQTRELERLSQVKSDFVSMVSHELRTPLAAMKEGVSLVADGSAGSLTPLQKKLLGITASNIDRLARLINELLDLSKIESGKIEMKFQETQIEKLIKSSIEIMQPHARSENIELKVQLEDNLPAIVVDIDRILQVLSNLINNAIKFTPPQGIITVCVQDRDTEFIEVAVEDTGVGISREDVAKLFQKFQQLDNAGAVRKPGGTGLGLAISKNIIIAHGGKMDVISEPKKGSRFFFTLPKYTEVINAYKYLDKRIEFAEKNVTSIALIIMELAKPADAAAVVEQLKHIARRPNDKIEYLGGKNIMIVLDVDKNGAQFVANRIKEKINAHYNFKIGAGVYPEDATERDDLVRIAKQRKV
ncbi:MAG: ATP-binding protein [Candidatus Omnitrophota bacterium]